MPNLTRVLFALFAVALMGAILPGCATKQEIKPEPVPPPVVEKPVVPPPEAVRAINPQSGVCRSCHTLNAERGAKDFSTIYDNPKSHHPVGVQYPQTVRNNKNFKLPDGQSDDVMFFDRNANGKPDSDEIQLFGASGLVTVECASCHSEHGRLPVSGKDSAKGYLRVDNAKSALCEVCHNS